MKTVIINECEEIAIPAAYTLDLGKKAVKDCTGCWTCWWATPGRCAFKDLDEFYHQYITADKAIFFAKVTMAL
jgi:multimeric flavodoxin WrbA